MTACAGAVGAGATAADVPGADITTPLLGATGALAGAILPIAAIPAGGSLGVLLVVIGFEEGEPMFLEFTFQLLSPGD